MKKVMNTADRLVEEMCCGLVLAHPELEFDRKYKIIARKTKVGRRVALISGGGSGHEPAHAGFVGEGMLDAAVCGDVFASPSQVQVYHALQRVAGEGGVLMIIKNYSGDLMNFQNAAALAAEDGIAVAYVKVADDIAVRDSLYTVGRRGVAGTVLVHKIAGAAAAAGLPLEAVRAAGQKAADRVISLGFAYSSCTVPAKGSPTFDLGEGEMEFGVGIHGEPGIRRESLLPSHSLAQRLVNDLLADRPSLREAAVLVNGFGATPLQELYILNQDVCRVLVEKGVTIYRIFVGNYMTSIDMAGGSVSLLDLDDELKKYLDAPSNTPAFKMDGSPALPLEFTSLAEDTDTEDWHPGVETDAQHATIRGGRLTLENLHYIVDVMAACVIQNEVLFCDLDSHAGDGDFGMSLAKGFRQVKREWQCLRHCDTPSSFLQQLAMVIMQHCGGASGPIWGAAFRSAGRAAVGKTTLSVADVADMLQAAVKGIQAMGERSFGRGAVVGDKTLIDALVPCAEAWASAKEDKNFKDHFIAGAEAAVRGAEKTRDIVAHMGRAGTVGKRSLGHPDAGAFGLGVIFTDIANHMQ